MAYPAANLAGEDRNVFRLLTEIFCQLRGLTRDGVTYPDIRFDIDGVVLFK